MAKFKAAAVFSSNMVIQRDKNVKVFGTGSNGESVIVSFCGNTAVTEVTDEKWSVVLPAMKAGGPYEMKISNGEDTIVFSNVMIGEVWLAGGQSNMELELQNCLGGKDYLENDKLSPDLVFKSPYFLEFTGLRGMYSEKSLEDSLVANLEQFMLEMGNGFTFVERQKRMIIDGEDFYLDLLFYHRRLHRLIAVDLKLGRFKAQYKGQMELYLRWLEANEMEAGEESPLGLLLCTEGREEQIELLQLDKAGIKVAQYMTELPPRNILVQQIQESLHLAKSRWEQTGKA